MKKNDSAFPNNLPKIDDLNSADSSNKVHMPGNTSTVADRPRGKSFNIGKFRIEHWQLISVLLAIFDYLAVIGSYFFALWMRFDVIYSQIPARYMSAYSSFTVPFAILCVIIFFFFRMYNSMWRYVSFAELSKTVLGSLIASVLHSIGITVFFMRMPMAYYLIGAVLQLIAVIGIRFA
ncbi:MAG: hypothetical protein IKE24_12235 [Clostridia bacterium]|nr:hypothetical protein [Clostridia bacterium]